MKTYIFYTGEGFTESPNEDIVENFQILGFENGINLSEALHHLFDNNQWIFTTGFSEEKILHKEIVDAS